MVVHEIPLEKVVASSLQPRNSFSGPALQELARDIQKSGVWEPIIVRKGSAADTYQIIAGERRTRAARLAGLQTIPAIITEQNDHESLSTALRENMLREDLTPIEEARALGWFRAIGLSEEEVAEEVSKSEVFVRDRLALLSLPVPVQNMLEAGSINLSQAKVLLEMEDPDSQCAGAEYAAKLNLTATELRTCASSFKTTLSGAYRTPHAHSEIILPGRLTRTIDKAREILLRFDPAALTEKTKPALRESLTQFVQSVEELLRRLDSTE